MSAIDALTGGISFSSNALNKNKSSSSQKEEGTASFQSMLDTQISAGGKAEKSAEINPAHEAREAFLKYMKMTPEERYFDAFLKRRNMTQEEFNALPPEEKKALLETFEEEMKQKIALSEKEKQEKSAGV